MRYRAKCCLCPWQTKTVSDWTRSRLVECHQTTTGHTRIKLKDR